MTQPPTSRGGRGKQVSPVDAQIANLIRFHRRRRAVSQEGLAASIGVSFQQLQKYENGANRVSAGRLFEIAAALDVPLIDLFPQRTAA